MIKQHPEPSLWLLFSAGGVLSAMLMPILLLLFGVAFPFGWVAAPSHAHMADEIRAFIKENEPKLKAKE